MSILTSNQSGDSLKDEYESLLGKAKQLGLTLEASRLTNAYNAIKYHSLNPDEETRRETIEQFRKIASDLREKIKETR